jgi:hypothetical protein
MARGVQARVDGAIDSAAGKAVWCFVLTHAWFPPLVWVQDTCSKWFNTELGLGLDCCGAAEHTVY